MDELGLFMNEDCTDEVKTNILFQPVRAGGVTQQSVWVKNLIKFPLNLKVDLKTDDLDVSVVSAPSMVEPKSKGEVVFEFSPKMTRMSPVSAEFEISIDYVVK